ncbi:Hypothetical predicted protein [Marmota monax]|uniref:Uncharacterized protein n=1 Tax=Marmota monax TaxID=9995 RepID=A0A5E4CVD5_MARMO|nr:hypothetical protein GHT09_015374 [Marmota monax]VTJ85784.1 Hypothetical predicted protein [Marmota monax]
MRAFKATASVCLWEPDTHRVRPLVRVLLDTVTVTWYQSPQVAIPALSGQPPSAAEASSDAHFAGLKGGSPPKFRYWKSSLSTH